MPEDDEVKNLDDPSTAFPASEATPGQAQSRISYKDLERLNDQVIYQDLSEGSLDGTQKNGFPWWEIYLNLRARKITWRKAAFIAWSCVPTYLRVPKTKKELATQILGLKSDRTLRKWLEKDPTIADEIESASIALCKEYLPNVLQAWGMVASSLDPRAHRDRITFLIHAGVYTPPKTGIALSGGGKDDPPVNVNLEGEYLEDLAKLRQMLDPEFDEEEAEEEELSEIEAGDE